MLTFLLSSLEGQSQMDTDAQTLKIITEGSRQVLLWSTHRPHTGVGVAIPQDSLTPGALTLRP